MTKEELAHEIAVGLIKTGVEGPFSNVCSSTAGDYPSIGISSWEGNRADNILKQLPGAEKFIGRTYSSLAHSGDKSVLANLLDSAKGRQIQLETLANDCIMYVEALWDVATLDDTRATIYAGIWCPTSHNVVRKFLQKREVRGYNLRSLETVHKLFYDQYADAAGVPECTVGYQNRALRTYHYVKALDLSTPSTLEPVREEIKEEVSSMGALKVFINPGHSPEGSSDPDVGAVNERTGLQERDVAMVVGKKMAGYLNAIGIETYIYQYPSLMGICQKSNEWDSDLFVSIHCNASGEHMARGTETWCFYGSTNGRRLAECVQKQLVPAVYSDPQDQADWDRHVREGGWTVIQHTDCPAVLTELAFIDNAEDGAILADPNKQDEIARALARAITDYQNAYMG